MLNASSEKIAIAIINSMSVKFNFLNVLFLFNTASSQLVSIFFNHRDTEAQRNARQARV